MDASLTELQTEFEDIQFRAEDNWAFVTALRECFEVGMPAIEASLVPYLNSSVRTTMGDSFPKISEVTHHRVLEGMAAYKVTSARCLIDAAAILVIQATLDFAVNEYLVLIAKAAPGIWEPNVGDEQLPLKTIRDTTYPELLRSKAISFARSFSTKSLSKKIQTILDRCYSGEVELSPPTFRFDVERVKRFDDVRHDIAHGRAMGIVVENMDEILPFLWHTLLSLNDVIGSRLELRYNRARSLERPLPSSRSVRL